MKILNFSKISLFLFALISIGLVGCIGDDFEGTTYPGNEFTVGGTIVNVANVVGEYDIAMADEAIATYSLFVGGVNPGTVDVNIAHSGGASGSLPSVSSFPAEATITLAEALSATGLSLEDLEVGDNFKVTFAIPNGNVGSSFSIPVVSSAVVFRSALQGEFTAVTTCTNQAAGIGWDDCEGREFEGVIMYEAQHTDPEAEGAYKIFSVDASGSANEDMSHGAFYPCYNADAAGLPLGDLVINDVDGKLSVSGVSQWGEVYSLSDVTPNGAALSFGWTNDYGEGASVVLTRTDGTTWPENLK
ncbi:MAG: hypothetical protein V3V14_00735 [Saprospiraceae bacterium]